MSCSFFFFFFIFWEKIRAVLVGKETESVCVLLVYLPPWAACEPGRGRREKKKKKVAEYELEREQNQS